MTNLDPRPDERVSGDDAMHPGSSIIEPREVPLGGPRAMTVRRTLPARGRTMIGAYCFVDHYGPDDVSKTGGMVVPPHPHTALQTVSWLFSGQIEHRDSTGVVARVVPGQLNLMTAGHGVCHSEVSVVEPGVEQVLLGVQLWTALPERSVDVAPHFDHFEPEPVRVDGASVSVFLGSLTLPGGREVSSPVTTYTPLLGAEIRLEPEAELVLGLDRSFEHGVLLDRGELSVNDGCALGRTHLLHEAPGPGSMTLSAGEDGADLILLGGPPFGEQIVMWWNFIGRTHEDVVAAREQWQAELGHDPDGRFGAFDYPGGESLSAPGMPHVRLRPRG